MYINGKIDLVFKENDEWVIVDYKTCDVGQIKKALYYEYLPQLEVYKQAWNKISGAEKIKTELFFIEKM